MHASGLPGAQEFIGKRTSDWAPEEVERFKVPGPDSDDALIAVISVWARWAKEPSDERWWRRQVESAREEQTRERAGGPAWKVRARQSVYWWQVRRIAPQQLFDREEELAELARFCTAADSRSYSWWRAPKWSGKTALMTWFALHPPPRVQVVPFFVTARYAAQNDRTAFTEIVMGQLASLLGEDLVSQYLTDAVREPYYLDLLDRAAALCGESGTRLVLLVDGLDEDRGVTSRPDAHSIAALLPDPVPANLRVLIASRNNPPPPDDVPKKHPLFDPSIIRVLGTSPHAHDIQGDLERELKRLLEGTQLEQDLLGLITAAGGGLSAADLAELIDQSAWTVRNHLHTVTGRTFEPRESRWRPHDGHEVYILGHEELQVTAKDAFGASLTRYLDRIHTWADGYRLRSWPQDTPEYLFSGYFGLLRAHNNLDRLIELTRDAARHERMLDLTGSDAAALAELTTVRDMILGTAHPGAYVLAMARIAGHLDRLEHRNDRIPTNLPALWAKLGYVARAKALARAIKDDSSQTAALIAVAQVVAVGDPGKAESFASTIDNPSQRRNVLTAVVDTVATHDPDLAEQIARRIGTRLEHEAQVDTILIVARGGDLDRAEQLARSIDDSHHREWTLAQLAHAVAARDPKRAERLAAALSNEGLQLATLSQVVQAMAVAGHVGNAEVLAYAINRKISGITDTVLRSQIERDYGPAARDVAGALAAAGNPDRALQFARANSQSRTADILTAVASAVAAAGNSDFAQEIINELQEGDKKSRAYAEVARATAPVDPDRAEVFAREIPDPQLQARTLAEVAEALAESGDPVRATSLAKAIEDADAKAQALIGVASAMITAGDTETAEELARGVEALVRTVTSPQARALLAMTKAVAAAGDAVLAEALANTMGLHRERAEALIAVAAARAAEGEINLALELADSIAYEDYRGKAQIAAAAAATTKKPERSLEFVRSLGEPWRRHEALIKVIGTMASRDPSRAQLLVEELPYSDLKAEALAVLAEEMAALDLAHARSLSTMADSLARATHDRARRSRALIAAARAIAATGDVDHAVTVAGLITNIKQRWQALAWVARATARAGQVDRAIRILNVIAHPVLHEQARIEVACGAASAGNLEHALSIAQGISDPVQQAIALVAVAAETDTDTTQRLITPLLATPQWTTALAALPKIDVTALVALAREWLPQPAPSP
ncbi:hypothetical protein OHA74_16675 [Streptomyces phaeochromogenes]|uniref:hypothetical protein n=1 Tax=Streptomyces phaeochromogenes TaxID=1923 RepID=UPI002E2856ED|nr:hypothetical protein [Streptomyces phaeochromogenes]